MRKGINLIGWRGFLVSCVAVLAIMLLPAREALAQDARVTCGDPKMAVGDRVQCILKNITTQSKSGARKPSAFPDACGASDRWQKLLGGIGTPSANDGAAATQLKMACDQIRNLAVAETLLGERRYADAIAFLNKIGDPASLDEITYRVRRDLRFAQLQQSAVYLPPARIVDLERAQKFQEAYDALAKDVAENDAHLQKLKGLLTLQSNADSWKKRLDYASELAAWNTYLGGLDPYRDQYLLEAANRKITDLQTKSREQADADARSLIDMADVEISRADYTDAITNLTAVTARATSISPGTLGEATKKLGEARTGSAKEPTLLGTVLTFIWGVWKAFLSILNWVGYAAIIVAGTVAVWFLSVIWTRLLPPKQSILLTMTDRTTTADPTSATAAQANQALSEQVRRQMDLPLPDHTLKIYASNEMDGSSLGQASLRVPFRAADTVFQSNANVTFGPFSVNPFAIWQQIKGTFVRHHRLEIAGELYVLGSDTICRAELAYGSLDDKGKNPASSRKKKDREKFVWEAVASGDQAGAQAVRDLAIKILLAIDGTAEKITADVDSLSQFRLGLDFQRKALSDPQNASANWKGARDAFQQSALDDPGNWLARFNLGTAQQKLGLNSLAAKQFEELDVPARSPNDLAVIRYNRAAALQKTDDRHIAKEVIEMMQGILTISNISLELKLLALSGWLAATASRYFAPLEAQRAHRRITTAIAKTRSIRPGNTANSRARVEGEISGESVVSRSSWTCCWR